MSGHDLGVVMSLRDGTPQQRASNLLAFLLLVAMPGATSSVLAPSSKARSP